MKHVLLILALSQIMISHAQISELGFYAPLINSADLKYASNHVIVAQQGLKIFSIANPANPVQVGLNSYPGSGNSPHQLAVSGNYAYLGEGGNGYFSVYDISNFSLPSLSGSTIIPSSEFITGGDLLVVGATAYMTGVDSLYIIDVSNPSSPSLALTVQVINLPPFGSAGSLASDGSNLYILHSLGIAVYDISSPLNPVLLTTIPLTHAYHRGLTVDTAGQRLFSPWVDALQTHLGFNVYNISNPSTPVFLFADSITPGAGDFGNCDYFNNVLALTIGGTVKLFDVSQNHGFIASFSGGNVANASIAVEFRDSVLINGKRGGFEVLEFNGSFPVNLYESDLNNISVYPNPVIDGRLKIQGSAQKFKEVMISDVDGRMNMQLTIDGNSLELPELTAGLYILTFIGEKATIQRKILFTP